MIKRAHTEERPYRLIVPVVLHFRPLVAHFLLLVGGGQEGIVYFSFFMARIARKTRKRFPTPAGAGLGAGSAIKGKEIEGDKRR